MQAIDHAAQSLQNHYWCFDTLLKKKNKMQREFSEFNVKKKKAKLLTSKHFVL